MFNRYICSERLGSGAAIIAENITYYVILIVDPKLDNGQRLSATYGQIIMLFRTKKEIFPK